MEKNVLYYPSIEFIDTKWLRASLCIWDNIYRIVPTDYEPNDCDEVKFLKDEGLIHDITLTEKDLSKTAKKYEHFMKKLPFLPAAAEKKDEEYMNLNINKIDVQLQAYFNSLSKQITKKNFLKVSKEQVNLYMLFLAQTVASDRKMAKITDSKDMYTAIQFFQQEGLFDSLELCNKEYDESLASLILPIVIPKDVGNLDIKKIITIRNKNIDNRQQFRDSVENFTKEMASIEDIQYIKECAIRFRKEQREIRNSYMRITKEDISEFSYSFITTTVPTILTNYITSSSQDSTLGNSIALSLIATLPPIATIIRTKWKSINANYLLQLGGKDDGEFMGNSLKPYNFTSTLNEFIYD